MYRQPSNDEFTSTSNPNLTDQQDIYEEPFDEDDNTFYNPFIRQMPYDQSMMQDQMPYGQFMNPNNMSMGYPQYPCYCPYMQGMNQNPAYGDQMMPQNQMMYQNQGMPQSQGMYPGQMAMPQGQNGMNQGQGMPQGQDMYQNQGMPQGQGMMPGDQTTTNDQTMSRVSDYYGYGPRPMPWNFGYYYPYNNYPYYLNPPYYYPKYPYYYKKHPYYSTYKNYYPHFHRDEEDYFEE